jgi:hypothetical protein
MLQYSHTPEIGRRAIELSRGRLICELLRKEGFLPQNTRFVLELAECLLRSYTYRIPRSA